MIRSFDYFYGGHIEMEDSASPEFPSISAPNRTKTWPPSSTSRCPSPRCWTSTVSIQLWLAEYHFQNEGYSGVGNVPMLSVYLAQNTARLNFGSFFNTVPAWHALRLAKDYAVADVLTKGRMRFGIGRSYINREIEVFGREVIPKFPAAHR